MTENHIYLTGLNYRTAGVEVRERFALNAHYGNSLWEVPADADVRLDEMFILSTCNRVEVLGVGEGDIPAALHRAWARRCGRGIEDLESHAYTYRGIEAARHLFEVAAALDSMVPGEPQILGQLKEAYRKAAEARTTGTILNRMLHKAFSAAKRVRTETAVASSAVSISYAAVELAKRIFGDMRPYRAMLVGAGEMAELAATHLLQAGLSHLVVTNRTPERARELATRFKGSAAPFEELATRLAEADIVLSSTGSPEPVIRAQDIKTALQQRRNRPMFFIDIAVPRDIDPDVNNLDNVYLYDIDDLKEVVEENLAHRRDEADKARLIVEEEVQDFSRWLRGLELQPTIVELLRHFEQAADAELERTLKRLGHVDAATHEALETMVRSLAHKLSHDPLMFLRQAREHNNAERIHLTRRIFNLDGEPDKRCPYRRGRNRL